MTGERSHPRPGSQNTEPPFTAPRRSISFNPVTDKACGPCTLCCKLVPVAEIQKPAGRWCNHCTPSAGCKIYDTRPRSCREWSCVWLTDGNLPDQLRPDRCHVVFDSMVEMIAINEEPTPVLQAWLDPNYPDAFRQPIIMWAIDEAAKATGLRTLLRYDSSRGRLITAPCLGGWQITDIFTSTMPEVERERLIAMQRERMGLP